jgi:all-trans-retinol 13,14-reductase
MWDTIVIGSGIGGLGAAAALARRGQRVLVLEQHTVAGGLTQTFRRQRWCFATGVHYIGGVGPDPGPGGQPGRLLEWLSEGRLRFAPLANPYDIVHLPGFEFGIPHPQSAYRAALQQRFPHEAAAIQAWFAQCERVRHAASTMFALRAVPAPLAWALRLWRGGELDRQVHVTLAESLQGIRDAQLRAVLAARWGDYGAPPERAPLIEHDLVTGSYDGGAFYPVGGPASFVQALQPVIEAAGGELRLGSAVTRIVVEGGRAVGVEAEQGGQRRRESARQVISAMGVANTVACLDADAAPAWQATLRALQPGLSYLTLYLGFEGDIAAAGASSANHWIYGSDDVGRVWTALADEDAPGLFVSFPSLKDPQEQGAPTAEVVALCDGAAFAPWLGGDADAPRPEEYLALKAWVEAQLLAQFARHFPALAGLVRFHELSTPVTQQHYVRSPDGAMYGIEMSPERLTTPALRVRTPLPGLLLAGQDVCSQGVVGALMGGMMAAAAVDPALLRRLGA